MLHDVQMRRSATLYNQKNVYMSYKLLCTVKLRLVSPWPVPQPSADQLICLIPPSALQYDLQSAYLYVFHSHNTLNLQK